MKGILTVCLFISFSLAYAQEKDDDQADTTMTTYLSEITVAANRWEQNLLEVPAKISVVNDELIRFQNPQTAADLLNLSENVFVQKSQLGGGSPMIRGFATNRVMIVVDGVRMNNAIFRSGNVQNVISLDPNAVEEAEVVFGPGAVMYGSDAIGGVMDFHTLHPSYNEKPQWKFSGNAVARYSTANKEKTIHGDFNSASQRWSFLTSVTRSVYDDLRMGSNGPEAYTRPDYVERVNNADIVRVNDDPDLQVNSGYDQWNMMQKIGFKANEWFNTTYSFHYSKTSDYDRYDRLILREEGSLANGEWYYGPQKWVMHSLKLDHSKPTAISDGAKLIFAFQDYEESRHNRGFGGSGRTDRFENVKAFSVNLDFDKLLSEKFSLFYGGEFVTNTVNSVGKSVNINDGSIAPVSTRYPDGSTWRSSAVYATLRAYVSETVSVNGGLRYTNIKTEASFDRIFFDFPFAEASLNNNAINGSLGLVLNPSDRWKFYGTLSTGFRAPNVDDIGKVFDSEPGNVVVPNPALKPEYAYNSEVGLAGIVSDKLQLDFTAYYTILDNALARGPSTFNGKDSIDYDGQLSRVLALQNISEVWVAGVQVGFNWKLTNELALKSTLNYQKGKERDPESMRDFSPTHVPPLFGATHLIFTRKSLKADLYGVYNGTVIYEDLALSERGDSHLYAKDSDGNPYVPTWATLNLKLACKVTENFSVNTGIENILDKRYRPYASGISAPGRNFIIALRASI